MLKRLLAAIAATQERDHLVTHITQDHGRLMKLLEDLERRQRALEGTMGALETTVKRETMSMAELYGKTFRLQKRMQMENQNDAAREDEPDITPVADVVTERVMARRSQRVSTRDASSEG